MPLSFSLRHVAASFLVAGTLFFSAPAFADSITLGSGMSNTTVTYTNYAATNGAVTTFGAVTTGALAGTSYISYDPNTFTIGSPIGITAYTTIFTGNYLGGLGSITLAADDTVCLYLNGTLIGTTNGTTYDTVVGPTNYAGYLVNGKNTLTFLVSNSGGGPTDLDFKFSAVSATPEPSSFALLGTGMVGLAGFVRRKLRS